MKLDVEVGTSETNFILVSNLWIFVSDMIVFVFMYIVYNYVSM